MVTICVVLLLFFHFEESFVLIFTKISDLSFFVLSAQLISPLRFLIFYVNFFI